jgi:tetratricopeptide (TPR) repeat protein
LAYHYARAENWEKAQEYLFKAGDQAGKIAADAEALTHYQEAIETYTRVFGDKWDPLQRASLDRKMGEAFYRRGETQKAMEYLQRALVYLGRPKLPTSRSQVRFGILREIAVQIVHHIFSRWLIKKTYGPVDPAVEETARIYEIVGGIVVLGAAPEHFLLTNLKTLNFSQREGYLPGVVLAYTALAVTAFFLSFSRLARFFQQRALVLAGHTQHAGALAALYQNFAFTELLEGQLGKAIEHALKVTTSYCGGGYWNLNYWGYSNYFALMAYMTHGNFHRALELAQEMLRTAEDANTPDICCIGLTGLGHIQLEKGQFEESIANLNKAIDLAEAIPMHLYRILASSLLARCYLSLSDLDRSLEILTETENYMVKNSAKKTGGFNLSFFLPQVYLTAAEQSVKGKKAEWLKKAGRACEEALRLTKVYRFYLPLAMRLQGTSDWLSGEHSSAEKWWQSSLETAEKMGMPYYLGMTHLEMGKRLNDRTHVEKAEAIFAEIGAEFDLAQARKLLQASTM